MNKNRVSAVVSCLALSGALYGSPAAAATEIKGAAILGHPCGKVAVKQMGFLHAGNIDEANKLSTKEMQDRWKAMPAKDREMMAGMSKQMSPASDKYAADIRSNGVLAVDGSNATLTVKTTQKDANGSSTSTTTQQFRIDGAQCLVSR